MHCAVCADGLARFRWYAVLNSRRSTVFTPVVLVPLACFQFMNGGGAGSADMEALKSENDELKKQVEALTAELAQLKSGADAEGGDDQAAQ